MMTGKERMLIAMQNGKPDRVRGLVFVVDGYEKIVKVFNEGGLLLSTIPGPGTGPEKIRTRRVQPGQ